VGGDRPGKEESAEQNHSSCSAKGNKYLRRVRNQAAHAAVAKKGSHFQAVFRRLLPRLGMIVVECCGKNGTDAARVLDCWRPRRDLNPCYRRERAMS
jgi:hypothetical protein